MDGLSSRLSLILAVAVVALVLVCVTRLPNAPTVLSFDNVNLAFSIQKFDPWMHQPQPPGYPFFVAEAKLVDHFLHNPEKSFRLISILVTWLSGLILFFFARNQFGTMGGCVAGSILILNPTLWYADLDSPLRPHLALFSIAVAYLCWQLWNGEVRFALWAATVLAIGGGFRPDLLFYLFPLWCVSMWRSRASYKAWIRGIGILFGLTTLWIGIAAHAVGGLDRYALLMWVYTGSAMQETSSVLLNSTGLDWLYSVAHMIAWNAIGVLSWAWLLPLWLVVRKPKRSGGAIAGFFAVWILPGMAFQGVVHVAAPGHTLFSVSAWCIIGAAVIVSTCQGLSEKLSEKLTAAVAVVAAALNVLFFLNAVPIPILPASIAGDTGIIVSRALAEGAHQTTIADLYAANQLSESSVHELAELLRTSRPVVVVSTLGSSRHFHFLSSRIASYYVADREFWVIADEESFPRASRIHGKDLLEIRYGGTVKLPFPRGGRMIWLMDPTTPLRDAIARVIGLTRDGHIFHTDIDPSVSRFQIGNFEFSAENQADRILEPSNN